MKCEKCEIFRGILKRPNANRTFQTSTSHFKKYIFFEGEVKNEKREYPEKLKKKKKFSTEKLLNFYFNPRTF